MEKHIAIIGAGISGLASAYECAKRARQAGEKLTINIYEKSPQVGGNAQTRVFSLGKIHPNKKEDFFRWADLGVNDINLNTYHHIVQLMNEIGYDIEKRMRPLEDTVCFFSLDGDEVFTNDHSLQYGVSNPAFALDKLEDGKLLEFTEVINQLALDHVYPDGIFQPGAERLDITVSEFFDLLINHAVNQFSKYDKKMLNLFGPEWQTSQLNKVTELVKFLRDNQFYPRIAAMYFADDWGPEQMLLAAPYLYYCRQEGFGSKLAPKRCYFVGGSQYWLEYLAEYLESTFCHGDVTVHIHCDADIKEVCIHSNHVSIDFNHVGHAQVICDHVIVTTHADIAAQILSFDKSGPCQDANDLCQQEVAVRKILGGIFYTQSVAVAHTYSGVLPPDRDSWRSYNVLIRKGVGLKPYSMTYVCNRHQNDKEYARYDDLGLPQYFVTLNPQRPIPDKYVLSQIPYSEIPADFDTILPKSTQSLAKPIKKLGDHPNKKCITTFKHNLLNKECFEAQRDVKNFHKGNSRLSLGGGWTYGAGLQEECVIQAKAIADRFFPSNPE